jgi:hypothetical protein
MTETAIVFFFKVWWQAATLFYLFYIKRAYIKYLYTVRNSLSTASSCLHRFRSVSASSGVPSRDSNSGLPYSKPTRYYLRHAPAPWYVFNLGDILSNDDSPSLLIPAPFFSSPNLTMIETAIVFPSPIKGLTTVLSFQPIDSTLTTMTDQALQTAVVFQPRDS